MAQPAGTISKVVVTDIPDMSDPSELPTLEFNMTVYISAPELAPAPGLAILLEGGTILALTELALETNEDRYAMVS